MCGIVGLFLKNPKLQPQLGRHLSAMLVEMTGRGPDSAGIAVYREPVKDALKLTLFHADDSYDWDGLAKALKKRFGAKPEIAVRASHARLTVKAGADEVQAFLAAEAPDVRVMSAGDTIEIYKEMGLPERVIARFDLRHIEGTHALGHTRMATESAVTTAHSHPFSTGRDLCLVHNGSLSNHNRLRAVLKRDGIAFQTDNDSEVAAGYLASRLRHGRSLTQALEDALADLDGFYTFAIGTRDGFAVLRDPVGCKPAVLAETGDWVAMASEYRAIAMLPGAEAARVWEPVPAKVYAWERAH
ncbi:MAG: glutamine amidotransferase family protein [Alphaproteobacteria bacterium]|nr:glutamine amidotransferase family protein [Alphaproteobacteria bacterium]